LPPFPLCAMPPKKQHQAKARAKTLLDKKAARAATTLLDKKAKRAARVLARIRKTREMVQAAIAAPLVKPTKMPTMFDKFKGGSASRDAGEEEARDQQLKVECYN